MGWWGALDKMATKFIMNSMGRCGSTILFEFVFGYYSKKCHNLYIPQRKFMKDIGEINNETMSPNDNKIQIWKTHDPEPPKRLPSNVKFTYQFGNPLEVLLSTVYGAVNRKVHIPQHLKVDDSWVGTDKWVHEDVLGLEKHFDTWVNFNDRPIILIKYEDMWDNLDSICDFFDIPREYAKNFPAKRTRSFSIDNIRPEIKEVLMNTYRDLYQKIENFKGTQ